MRIFESFKKLFDREPTYNEVAIKRREKFWDEKYRRMGVQNAWDARNAQRKQKMIDAANLYVNTGSTYTERAIAAYHSGTFYNTSGLAGLGKLTIGPGF